MSTKSDPNETIESQEREVIDVIEVPPAKSHSGGAEVDDPDANSDIDETVPGDDTAADVEDANTVEPEDGGDPESAEEDDGVDVDDERGVESEDDGESESDKEANDAGVESPTQAEPPSHFQCAVTAGTLKSVVSTIGAIVDESRIHIDGDGLWMRAVDPANVAMDDLEVDAAAFEAYDATTGVIAVDLDRFTDIIKLAKQDDLVQVFLDHETRKLVIHIDGLEFTMACLAPDSLRTEPDTPDLDLPAGVTVDRAALDRGIKAADMVSDDVAVRLDGSGERFLIEAEGDTDEVSYEIPEEDIAFESLADAEAWFSLDYLKKLVKSTPSSTDVTIRFGTDFPLVMTYDLADGHGRVTRMLAPRIRSD